MEQRMDRGLFANDFYSSLYDYGGKGGAIGKGFFFASFYTLKRQKTIYSFYGFLRKQSVKRVKMFFKSGLQKPPLSLFSMQGNVFCGKQRKSRGFIDS
ncbi:MAG: hypothetical protein IJC26_02950 [Clostridia bacterium]|nr:hypothetical protein [Clostridia bacterium]